jgi:hypothetical protein
MRSQVLLELLSTTKHLPRRMLQMNPLNSTIITNPVVQYNYVHKFPPKGDFKGHDDEQMLKNMYDAITRLDLWDWLKTYKPEEGKGFLWSTADEITQISNAVLDDGHSGPSFAFCLRHMESIAKNGWEHYYKNILMN